MLCAVAPPPLQLIDYQKLPGGGRSLFNVAGGENPKATELVELRVYVGKVRGRLKSAGVGVGARGAGWAAVTASCTH